MVRLLYFKVYFQNLRLLLSIDRRDWARFQSWSLLHIDCWFGFGRIGNFIGLSCYNSRMLSAWAAVIEWMSFSLRLSRWFTSAIEPMNNYDVFEILTFLYLKKKFVSDDSLVRRMLKFFRKWRTIFFNFSMFFNTPIHCCFLISFRTNCKFLVVIWNWARRRFLQRRISIKFSSKFTKNWPSGTMTRLDRVL